MSLYEKATLVQIPSGYKASSAKLYSVIPADGDGDFTVSVDADATRVNSDGLIESVSANQARLNYDFDNPQDPHLLLEPTRTQLAEYTNAISSSNGYTLTNGTLTTDSHTAPDGSNDASTFVATSNNGQFQKVKTGSSGVEYTVSAYVKRKTGTGTVYLRAVENTNTAVTVTDEWTRVSLTVTSTSTNIRYGMALATSGDEIYVWGFQVEAGSYATSFIPNTSTGQITRTVDNAHLLDQTIFTNYPFTVYAKVKLDAIGNTIFSLNNNSSQNYYLAFYFPNSTQVGLLRRDLSTNDSDFYSFSGSVGATYKIAVAFVSATAYKLYIDGTEIADITSGSSIPFNHDDISLGQFRITGDTGSRNSIDEFMVFNEALSDSELIQITS